MLPSLYPHPLTRKSSAVSPGGRAWASWPQRLQPLPRRFPASGLGAPLRPLFPTHEVHLPSLSLLRPQSALLPAALAGHSCPLGGPEPRRKEAGLEGGWLGTRRTGPGVEFGVGGGEEGRHPVGWLFSHATSLVAQLVKSPPLMQETWVRSLGWEDPLEKGNATHSSILAWRIPWTVWSSGLQRVGHD